MTSFLRTRKDRHPKPENKARLPHEHDQSGDTRHSELDRSKGSRDGQVDTDERSREAPYKNGDGSFDKSH